MAAAGGESALDLFRFQLPQKELEETPSRRAGVTAADEEEQRRVGCDMLLDAGMLLGLPMVCVARAQVLLQRFYYRKALTEYDVAEVAPAVLFLATKLEECHTKLRQVLIVFHRLHLRRAGHTAPGHELPQLEIGSEYYFEVREALDDMEKIVLRELGYVCFVEHPHKYVLWYCKMLSRQGWEDGKELAQAVWSLVNDSLRTTVCCRFDASTVACAAMYLAMRRVGMPFTAEPWWELFNTKLEDLVDAAAAIAASLALPRPVYKKLCTEPRFPPSYIAPAPPPKAHVPSVMLGWDGAERCPTAEGGSGRDTEKKRRRRRSSSADSASSSSEERSRRRRRGRDRRGDRRDRSRSRDRDRREPRRRRASSSPPRPRRSDRDRDRDRDRRQRDRDERRRGRSRSRSPRRRDRHYR
eukprot:TRINITY_DN175_c5_g1_i1.p1 TRINITY_DN175_c5_g1~~TRINITY_DN175_c5_g1_i1.p1  ORF type:complete len:412 (+),score=125.50 TRINITY_DN175_c5_g1_i1:47-1282(+)